MFVFAVSVCFFYELSKWACETTRTRDVDSLALDLWPIQDTFTLCVGQDTFRLCVGQDRPLSNSVDI